MSGDDHHADHRRLRVGDPSQAWEMPDWTTAPRAPDISRSECPSIAERQALFMKPLAFTPEQRAKLLRHVSQCQLCERDRKDFAKLGSFARSAIEAEGPEY